MPRFYTATLPLFLFEDFFSQNERRGASNGYRSGHLGPGFATIPATLLSFSFSVLWRTGDTSVYASLPPCGDSTSV
jgi:hypothetical protein